MAINAVASGIQIFLQANQRLNASAQKIASANLAQGPASIVEPLIDLNIAEQQAKAGARVIETENKTIGALLDIKA